MSKGKLLAICAVWLIIVGVAAVAWKLIFVPVRDSARERGQQDLLDKTSGQSQYDHTVDFALDSFSGYSILRSDTMRQELVKKKIKANYMDDRADYVKRLESLRDGKVMMAAFTIDALIKASSQIGDLPAVIVGIIDETRGADAMVAYKSVYPNVDAMNRADTRFVLMPDSPSETLARVVMTHFNLDKLSDDPFVDTGGADDTFRRYQQSSANSKDVYVLWEPYVSQILENDNMHVVVDSSRFRGYIVDVIVVSRDYLAKQYDVVRDFMGCYFRAAYRHRQDMASLVEEDARRLKQKLSPQQARKLVDGIRWKNTQENFSHFGILADQQIQHIEDMISNITLVLKRTGAIAGDPTGGHANQLYFDRVLKDLRDSNFHPGLANESIQDDAVKLPALRPEDWKQLREVGELSVRPLVFAPGTSQLTETSHAKLDELVQTLNTWPQYYVLVRGNASLRGDLEANKRLAENRARAAAQYLTKQGIGADRVHAVGADPSGETSVSFVLGEAPY